MLAMNVHRRIALVAIAVIAPVLSACGGSSSTLSAGESPARALAEFARAAKGDAKATQIVKFGHDANSQELAAASAVLEENLRARAAEDWSGQCSSLSAGQAKDLAQRDELFTGKKGNGTCAEGLQLEAEPVSHAVLKNPMTGPVDVLLVGGPKGYALFHGTLNKDYAMPMLTEAHRWKVDQLTTVEIGKG